MTKKELKYVNSLKEENERVKTLLMRFVDALGKLRNIDDAVNISLIPLMTEQNQKFRAEVKANAYKEFAERLKAEFLNDEQIVNMAWVNAINHIDRLVKEMVGE